MHQIYYLLIFDYYFLDSKENFDLFAYSIWKCMKRINSNLNFLAQKFNDVESEIVPSSTLDYDHFLLMFPLKELKDVIELESRLADDSSDFTQKFVSSFIIYLYYYLYNIVVA